MYLFFLERYPHGIFAAGGAYVPTQEKKEKKKPKPMRHDLMVEAQYPQAPTSTAKKCMDQPFALIAEQSGSYFPNLVACHDSIFSSQGQVSSRIITVFAVVE